MFYRIVILIDCEYLIILSMDFNEDSNIACILSDFLVIWYL